MNRPIGFRQEAAQEPEVIEVNAEPQEGDLAKYVMHQKLNDKANDAVREWFNDMLKGDFSSDQALLKKLKKIHTAIEVLIA